MGLPSRSALIANNQLLARLPQSERGPLESDLEPVELIHKQVLYRTHGPIDFVYFPANGVVSAMTILTDGRSIEVATVGHEGMVGLTAFVGGATSPNEVMVQVEGNAVRIRLAPFQREIGRESSILKQLLIGYHAAYSTQVSYAVACNGLHTIEPRCCRWLLMTQDRVRSPILQLTHEFLAIMLGVRRASVTEVLRPLQDRGLIANNRGSIEILDRPALEALACECYGAVNAEFARIFA